MERARRRRRERHSDKLVTRDQLLTNEPHNLMTHADRNPLTSLAMHYALRAFPAKPGTKGSATAKKDREQFLEAYRSVKDKAEELAKTHGDHDALKAVEKQQSHVGELVKQYRGQKTNDYIVPCPHRIATTKPPTISSGCTRASRRAGGLIKPRGWQAQ